MIRSAGVSRGGSGAGGAYMIQPGDTLSEIARRSLVDRGEAVNGASIARETDRIARDNGIENPDLIFAGSTLRIKPAPTFSLGSSFPGAQASMPNAGSRVQLQQPWMVPAARASALGADSLGHAAATSSPAGGTFPQLDRTLDRAVAQGFIPPEERAPVHDRVVQLARKYQFSPDDFATVALMESDGLNPRATNGRCHGIIQFCEGASSGAASVGMQGRAAEIGQKSVLQQLELVDRYFGDTRLGEQGPVSLVDLYLTVLTPAARTERRADAPLDIGGTQAKVLHPQGDRGRPITRGSLLTGLIDHARARLEPLGKLFGGATDSASGPAVFGPQNRDRLASRQSSEAGVRSPGFVAPSNDRRGRQG